MRNFVSDSTWILLATLIDKGFNLLTQSYLVWQLGLNKYGIFSSICALGQMATTPFIWRSGELSIQSLESTDTSNNVEKKRSITFLVAHDIILLGIGSLVLAPLLFFIAPLIKVPSQVWLLSFLCVVNIGHAAIRGIQTIENRYFHLSAHAILSTIIQAMCIITMAFYDGLNGAIFGLLIGNVLKTLIGWLIERHCAKTSLPRVVEILRELTLSFTSQQKNTPGWYSFARGILQQVFTNGDTLAIGFVSNSTTVGLYKIARTGASVPGFMLLPIVSVFRGRIIAAWSERNIPRLKQLLKSVFFLGLFGAFAAIFISPLVTFLISPKTYNYDIGLVSATIGSGFVLFQIMNATQTIFAILTRVDLKPILQQLLLAFLLILSIFCTANHGISQLSLGISVVFIFGAFIFAMYCYNAILLQEKPSQKQFATDLQPYPNNVK